MVDDLLQALQVVLVELVLGLWHHHHYGLLVRFLRVEGRFLLTTLDYEVVLFHEGSLTFC
jgi:hypothetical protein